MKKLLGIALAFTMCFGAVVANADVLKSVKTSGEIQVLGSYNRYAEDHASAVTARVLYGVSATLAQDVKANVTLAYNNVWGSDVPAGAIGTEGKNLDTYLTDIKVIEGNIELFNLFCAIDAKIGRQFYGDENSAVIYFGPNHYNTVSEQNGPSARALDAANFSYTGENVSWNFVYAKTYEAGPFYNAAALGADNDNTIVGLDLTAGISDSLKVQAYFYDVRVKDGSSAYDHLGFWGIKPSFTAENFSAAIEYARNFEGDRIANDVNQDLIKVDLALNLGAFNPYFTFVRGNEFVGYGNYTPGLILGQAYGSVITYNENVYVLGADFNFENSDKLTYSVNLLGYQPTDHFNKWNDYEGNVWVKYAHNKNVELHIAGGAVKTPGDDHFETKLQSGVIVKF